MMLRSVSMKPLRLFLLAGSLAAAAACVRKQEAPPQPEPQPPVQRPAQQLPPPPPPAPEEWRDVPLTPGGWYYRNEGATSQALFGVPDSEGSFIVRCDRATRRVTLSRDGATTGSTMTVRTTSVARNLPLSVQTEPLAYVSGAVAASDPLLDAIAFSRGRFTVEVAGLPILVLPAWPEPARVIEDCRP
jgi:hypothetical protein